jgi:hypothetical protein
MRRAAGENAAGSIDPPGQFYITSDQHGLVAGLYIICANGRRVKVVIE